MKNIYTTLVLLTIAVMSFSQPYLVYTAKNNGNWNNAGNWTIVPRTDGVPKHKVLIPAGFSIIVDNTVNSMGLGDIQVVISGTLSLVPNTTVTLTNSSSIQLNSGFISGSAANQQITIGGVIKYKGDLDGAKTGASIADNTTGISPSGFKAFSVLPVNFTSFYINKSDNNIHLSWSTDKEINNNYFDVERSFNGVEWKKMAIVLGTGTTNSTNNYSYTDKNVSGAVVYYRLRQVDIDGHAQYSTIKTIRMNEAVSAIKIYGFQKNAVVEFNTAMKNNIEVNVLNNNGQVIFKKAFKNPSYKITLNLASIATGAYIINVTDSKGLNEVQKVIL